MFEAQNTTTSQPTQEDISHTFEQIKKFIDKQQLDEAKAELFSLHYADLADFLDHNSHEVHKRVLPLLIDDFDAETLIWLSARTKASVTQIYGDEKIASLIDNLDIEDAIEVIDDLELKLRETVLELLPEEKRYQVLEGFNYPELTTGRVMEKKYIAFFEHWTTGQAIDSIRRNPEIPDNFHAAVVVDTKNRPVGSVLLSALMKHGRNTPIRELMDHDLKVADTHTNLDDLSYIFKQYALTIVPVINKVGKLVGTVSINNMVYIIQEQAEEAILHLGGVNEVDTYQNLISTAKQRFPWLFINLITACLTAQIITHYGPTIAQLVTLASIMPIVASMGGNAGTQTMTVTVRAIANKEVNKANNAKIILKELLSCGLNGVLLAALGGSLNFILFNDLHLSLVFAIAVIINFVIAGFCGSAIPLVLSVLKTDPAPASGVILTAITDSCGFFIFLGLAKAMLL